MRHPKEGAPKVASMFSGIPVINAGDGGHQHPTQTLTDLFTIRTLKGHTDNMTIGLCGDLKFGRTVHSLIESLVRYENVKFVLISPPELRVPSYIRDEVLKGFEFKDNAVVLEEIAKMNFMTELINPNADNRTPQCMQDKHFLRKHGPNAYYGHMSSVWGRYLFRE